MSETDKIAQSLRRAYADHETPHEVDPLVPWHRAGGSQRAAWRAIARKAQELGAKVRP